MLLNKIVYIALSMQKLSKILMYEFRYDHVRPKHSEKAILCYIDTGSFLVYIKENDFYKDIIEDVESRFDSSNYESDRPLPKGKK